VAFSDVNRPGFEAAVDRCEEWETMGELIEPLRQYAI